MPLAVSAVRNVRLLLQGMAVAVSYHELTKTAASAPHLAASATKGNNKTFCRLIPPFYSQTINALPLGRSGRPLDGGERRPQSTTSSDGSRRSTDRAWLSSQPISRLPLV